MLTKHSGGQTENIPVLPDAQFTNNDNYNFAELRTHFLQRFAERGLPISLTQVISFKSTAV